MSNIGFRRLLLTAAGIAAVWLCGKTLLPLLYPFLLGLGLALTAEPGARLLSGRYRWKRAFASAVTVGLTLIFVSGLFLLLFSLLIRQMGQLAGILPDLEEGARQGLDRLEQWLLSLAARTPQGIRALLTRAVLSLFRGGGQFYDEAIAHLPGLATGILSHLPDSVLGLGTGVLSAFLFSTQLPRIRSWLSENTPQALKSRLLPALQNLRSALSGWLKAQSKLFLITFGIVTGGLILLGISYGPVWALLIALVDAVPMLGTGIILIPWSLICFLQSDPVRGAGLLGVFAAAVTARTALEPRLLGRQLGLDPLLTLAALYLGYRLFGVVGLLLAPALTVALRELLRTAGNEPPPPPKP